MAIILIVDDMQTDREILGRIVTGLGHQALFATNGESAVQMAGQYQPELVLLDVVMPQMDGFNACRRLKKDPATASIKVVLVTRKGSDSDKFWGRKQGADGHLVKPYTTEQVKQMVAEMLA